MDKNEHPGIVFEGVHLQSLHFKVSEEIDFEKLPYQVDFEVRRVLDPDKTILHLILEVDLAKGVENPPMEFRFTMVGTFRTIKKRNLDLEEFAEIQAPSLLMPYVRELISNITSRSLLPPLIIPPLNILAMIKRKREDQAEFEKLE